MHCLQHLSLPWEVGSTGSPVPVGRWRNRGLWKCRNVVEIVLSDSGGSRIWTQVCLTLSLRWLTTESENYPGTNSVDKVGFKVRPRLGFQAGPGKGHKASGGK